MNKLFLLYSSLVLIWFSSCTNNKFEVIKPSNNLEVQKLRDKSISFSITEIDSVLFYLEKAYKIDNDYLTLLELLDIYEGHSMHNKGIELIEDFLEVKPSYKNLIIKKASFYYCLGEVDKAKLLIKEKHDEILNYIEDKQYVEDIIKMATIYSLFSEKEKKEDLLKKYIRYPLVKEVYKEKEKIDTPCHRIHLN